MLAAGTSTGQASREPSGPSEPSGLLLSLNFSHCGFRVKKEAHSLIQVIALERPSNASGPTSLPHQDLREGVTKSTQLFSLDQWFSTSLPATGHMTSTGVSCQGNNQPVMKAQTRWTLGYAQSSQETLVRNESVSPAGLHLVHRTWHSS